MATGISLGWNCKSAMYAVDNKLRHTRAEGYNTCVFDIMVSHYKGVVQCIKDDFKYFLDMDYITIKDIRGENFIVNTYYNFWFNHESPGHADLYKKENWPGGIHHFTMNNFQNFITRYSQRIQNFRNYINSGNDIIFILNRYNTRTVDDIPELNDAIKSAYPSLNYSFRFISNDTLPFIKSHLLLLGYDEEDDEVKRLGMN